MKTKTTESKENGNGKTGYGYGRFSDKPQERGDSYRRQTKWIKEYAEKNGINLLGIFFDEAVSGQAGKNLGLELGKALAACKPGNHQKPNRAQRGAFLSGFSERRIMHCRAIR